MSGTMEIDARADLDLARMRDDIAEAERERRVDAKPLAAREETFGVRYAAPDGSVHEATLTSRIMSGDERLLAARMAAGMAAGPWDRLPLAHQARIWQMATVTVQLRDPPRWLLRWITEDAVLLASVYEQLERHELLFFRPDGGEGSPGEDARRVDVATLCPSAGAPQPDRADAA